MDKPQDLHAREYAMQILESLGMPNDKGQNPNLILIADCLIGITKAPSLRIKGKNLTVPQAHSYMERAIRLAREQDVKVDRFFFRDAVYMQMRPVNKLPLYVPIDHKRTAEEQATPEFKHLRQQFEELIQKMATGSRMK